MCAGSPIRVQPSRYTETRERALQIVTHGGGLGHELCVGLLCKRGQGLSHALRAEILPHQRPGLMVRRGEGHAGLQRIDDLQNKWFPDFNSSLRLQCFVCWSQGVARPVLLAVCAGRVGRGRRVHPRSRASRLTISFSGNSGVRLYIREPCALLYCIHPQYTLHCSHSRASAHRP